MGLSVTKLWDCIVGKREMRIIMVGLDAAGKTTILYKLKLGEVVTTIPTVGFNVEVVEYKNISFTVWDIGGQDKFRAYFSVAQCVELPTVLLAFADMGLSMTKLWDRMVGKREMRIVMVGLDAAGKTTILYKLKLGEVVTTIPTVGFNVEVVEYKNINFTVWDIGGQDKIRKLWRHYYLGTHGAIFVVDSSDQERVEDACEELSKMLAEEE
eukprot:CAMPEP_0177193364 /NCGR_PEP_ID=MMETSP0367-20130122/22401_1 /TAXON_ID=447022 ORGANISM="Scrippsiella hangoei-like, Strain SHHI-4" /NCGR_SAMPLE_ID=MMETSP0367 /ASSEMBLY_ACC=CAM_ASM_000362 /LENGTH=210 /DNA_ID=CAMNT_0018641241 /DNA_START=31 /DNA_END=661 /DNA_ORIENTATION=-